MTLRRVVISWSIRAMSWSDSPIGMHSSRRLHWEQATFRLAGAEGWMGAVGVVTGWVVLLIWVKLSGPTNGAA